MDKRKSKGYTLIEILLVLMIMNMTSILLLPKLITTYENIMFDKQIEYIQMLLYDAKINSYFQKKKYVIRIYENSIEYQDQIYEFQGHFEAKQNYTIYYNEKGNVNRAQTLEFRNRNKEKKIVIWLGGGLSGTK